MILLWCILSASVYWITVVVYYLRKDRDIFTKEKK